MPQADEAKPVIATQLVQPFRNPSLFRGDGQDPNKWLKEYDRVAKFNKWDDLFCLANVYFFLEGTALMWFENNEALLTSWEKFKEELPKAFGDSRQTRKRAEEELKARAQKSGENVQSYIQSVLRLCDETNPEMPEEDKVAHLMKGIAEDFYQSLLTKELKKTEDFIRWCRYIEEMKERRVNRKKFDRLPNVIPMSSIGEETDLASLIRQIVREEVQRALSPVNEPRFQSIEAIVREEVQDALSPITQVKQPWTEVSSKTRRPQRFPISVNRQRPVAEPEPRRTDVWRTADNKPVCFHCGRPGHVVRYCRDRRAIFEASRQNRRDAAQSEIELMDPADYSRKTTRTSSPSPTRGRSPTRRYRSPSPYRRSSISPSRRIEEN